MIIYTSTLRVCLKTDGTPDHKPTTHRPACLPARLFTSKADLRRERTTLVCCSANWGAGGYLSVRPANGGGAGSASGADSAAPPADSAELGLVDATFANKPRAAVFRLVNCDDYTPQPFVGGRLMRNPGPPGGRGGGAGEQPPRNAGWR